MNRKQELGGVYLTLAPPTVGVSARRGEEEVAVVGRSGTVVEGALRISLAPRAVGSSARFLAFEGLRPVEGEVLPHPVEKQQ